MFVQIHNCKHPVKIWWWWWWW